jgi:hypothetical protein
MSNNKSHIEMYLDYVNNYITLAKFAEDYNISEERALYIVNKGRELNNK